MPTAFVRGGAGHLLIGRSTDASVVAATKELGKVAREM
jgi:hypothetical protein